MHTREEVEKAVPKSYEDVMKDSMLGPYLMTMGVWCKLVELGLVKDLDTVNDYLKDLWEKVLRDRIIKEFSGESNADK